MKGRLKVVQGGSSAGKTIAILLLLIDRAQSETNKTFSIVSETLPHLRRGAMRDFLSIMESHSYFDENRWNKTDCIYTFETKTKIEFFGSDNSDKVRGPRRDVLFINEANNLDVETYTQLAIRTNEDIFIDYNPVAEFWVHTDILPNQNNEFLILTYKDNEWLSPAIIHELESRMHRKEWWKVYGLGQLGEVEGKIYKGWQIIDSVPHEAKLVRYWLDFGYSQDPTSIGAIYSYNGGYILDEIAYQKGMSNKTIADVLKAEMDNRGVALVVADSSEPKSIDEISLFGVTIVGAVKGPDSVTYGIRVLQDQRVSITKGSVDSIKEYRNYLWMVDRNGKILNVPEGGNDHTMDGVRYAITSLEGSTKKQTGVRQFRPHL